MKLRRIATAAVAALFCAAILGGCTKEKDTSSGSSSNTSGGAVNTIGTVYPDKAVGFQLEKPAVGEEVAVMHTSMGDISIRFFPEAAPKAVENFKTHAKDGYFDGLIFHRVIKDFMLQGGDPKGSGTGGESIWGKAFEDEFDQKLLNLRGSLSMANSGVNTNGSQFFVNQAPASTFGGKDYFVNQESNAKTSYKNYYETNQKDLKAQYKTWEAFYTANALPKLTPIASVVPDEIWDIYKQTGGNINLDGAWRSSGGHSVFGQVFEGLDIVDAIAAVETDDKDKPLTPVTISSVEIINYAG